MSAKEREMLNGDVSPTKRPKREYMAFRGQRQPRVGTEFQVESLPGIERSEPSDDGTKETTTTTTTPSEKKDAE